MFSRISNIFIVCLMLIAFGGVFQTAIADTEANKELAHRFHMDLFQAGNLDAADEIIAEDFVVHFEGLPPELRHGIEGAKLYAIGIRTAFPDVQITHEDFIAEGDKVVIRWVSRSTHMGNLMGIPPTGERVTATGIDIFRIENGKIAELWQNWNQYGMMQQVGVIPPDREDYGWGEPLEVTGEPGEKEANKELAHRFHIELFNEGNLNAADEIIADDFVAHYTAAVPPEMKYGTDGVKLTATALRTGLPDIHLISEDTIASGDKVVIRWVMKGTQDGELLGIPPTGKPMEVTGIDIFRIEDGKLAEMW
ncbi:ester cyclase, partial [bacterium]|nr:ester cyclase [bacterium]